MLLATLFLAQALGHPRENPVAVVEWVDHYGYCLDVNFAQVIKGRPTGGKRQAAERAAGRCWPVRSSATSKIIEHLNQNGGGSDANERQEIADRVLNMVARSFAASHGVAMKDLGLLCAPTYSEDTCNAQD